MSILIEKNRQLDRPHTVDHTMNVTHTCGLLARSFQQRIYENLNG